MKAVVFILVGACFGVGATGLGIGTVRFLREAPRAVGELVALNAGGSHPQIRFLLPDGRAVSYPQGGWIAGYRKGDRVSVRYRPENPAATASIEMFGALWAWPVALAALGVVFAAIGFINRRQQARREDVSA